MAKKLNFNFLAFLLHFNNNENFLSKSDGQDVMRSAKKWYFLKLAVEERDFWIVIIFERSAPLKSAPPNIALKLLKSRLRSSNLRSQSFIW